MKKAKDKIPFQVRMCRPFLINGRTIKKIQNGEIPRVRAGKRLTTLERRVMLALACFRLISPSEWIKWWICFTPSKATLFRQKQFVENYCVGKLFVLAFILFISGVFNVGDGGCATGLVMLILGTFVVWMLLEALSATLYVQFVALYNRIDRIQSPNRSIILLLVAYLQVIIGFAFLYLWTQGIQGPTADGGAHTTVSSPWSLLYFSTVTNTTRGYGDYHPNSFWSQLCVITQTLVGLLMIVLMLATFISSIPRRPTNIARNNG